MNRNYRNMNGLRFLMLILGLMTIVNVGQVRPDDETSEEDVDDENFLSGSAAAVAAGSSDSAEEDDNNNKGIELYLSAMKDLYRQSKRQEAEPLVSSRSGASAPIAALYRRSALNKNFIRFGRSGGGVIKTDVSRQMQPTQPIRLMGLNESDSGKDGERSFHPARPSRSLRSNFIRFGRSFFPTSNRWGETVRRSARRSPSAGRQMMSLVHLPGSSSRR
ncbi:uncharacterized protein LOC124315587 [Daphnia pulicaria]|uniref:uncharacterized protein LOC124315587 n=1 Tax=Daphnia pulicaria TaxID=35523 RepID=UPI001EEBB6E2|nr:uncharacterized protein LOC124315587 [Daphnia pulicaria]